MRFDPEPRIHFPEVCSTQDEIAKRLISGEPVGLVVADHQTKGRGRLGRTWESDLESSLTVSLAFAEYADNSKPWLVGMGVAIAVAGALQMQLQWPNDIVWSGKKIGGVLTELLPDALGRKIPVVGVGVNLSPAAYPEELTERATDYLTVTGRTLSPADVLNRMVELLSSVPEPDSWDSLQPAWSIYDATPGKEFKLHDGQIGTALAIGPEGQLICSVEGETTAVYAADAWFGPDAETSQ